VMNNQTETQYVDKVLNHVLNLNQVWNEFRKINWTGINTEEKIKALMESKSIPYKFYYSNEEYYSNDVPSGISKFQMQNGKCITRGMQS
jgi:hypothetical protein